MKKKEHRQRGKKRKAVDDGSGEVEAPAFVEDRAGAGQDDVPNEQPLSWLMDKPTLTDDSVPFGLVDADLKAYLRSAHVTLQEKIQSAMQDDRIPRYDDEVKTLRNAMLDEVKGKELVLATDTDTSVILEGMLPSFGERQIRIICDALEREASVLARHRFGSHVLQSCLIALQPFIAETDVEEESGASLRSAQTLVVDITRAVQRNALDVMQNPFGTHVVRTLLLILSGRDASAGSLRSKRSAKFKRKANENGAATTSLKKDVHSPPTFNTCKRQLTLSLKQALCSEEVLLRSMCVDPVSGPTLALLVEVDDVGDSELEGDLLDKCLSGLMSDDTNDTRSAHVETLLRDSVGSHVLERLLKPAASSVVSRFWSVYIQDRFVKLAAHPVTNFVVSTLINRLPDEKSVVEACKLVAADEEGKIVQSGHMGIFTALLEVAKALEADQTPSSTHVQNARDSFWTAKKLECCALRAVLASFGISDLSTLTKSEEKVDGGLSMLLLSCKTVAESKAQRKKARIVAKRSKKGADAKKERRRQEDEESKTSAGPAITLQGSLLCQSIAQLHPPANQPLLSSLLQSSAFMRICSDASGVHVVLAALKCSQLAFSQRTRLSAKVLENIEALLNDKYGSRVVDATFDTADMYFKDKMARSCLKLERQLLASTYGRFFLKNIQIALHRRDVDAWKQAIRVQQSAAKSSIDGSHTQKSPSKKRKVVRAEDELDEILAEIN